MSLSLETRKNNLIKRLEERKNGEYELIGEYVNQRTRTLFRHIKCGHEWETTPHTLINAKGTLGCPYCQYKAKSYTTEEFSEILYKECSGRFSVMKGEKYVNSRTKISVVCHECGDVFKVSPVSLLKNKSCPTCREANKEWKGKTTEEFEIDLYKQKGDEYILADDAVYKGANEKIKIIHTVCGHEWYVRAAHILYRSGCPNCNESKGEKLVANTLNSKNVRFEREYKFEDCRNYKELPFDFALFDSEGNLKGLIEYDGVQHYKPFKHFGGMDKFLRQVENDRIKNNYCSKNNIPLLRLPYFLTKEEIEQKIDKFIVEL